MSERDGSGYVHDPDAFDEAGDAVEDASDGTLHGVHPAMVDREFDWRGWVLVAVVLLAFVVAPLAILLRPPEGEYLFTLIVLPLVPALLLAVTSVWASTRP